MVLLAVYIGPSFFSEIYVRFHSPRPQASPIVCPLLYGPFLAPFCSNPTSQPPAPRPPFTFPPTALFWAEPFHPSFDRFRNMYVFLRTPLFLPRDFSFAAAARPCGLRYSFIRLRNNFPSGPPLCLLSLSAGLRFFSSSFFPLLPFVFLRYLDPLFAALIGLVFESG